MSEYQYVAFQAVDRPLSDEQLEFAHTQSSRADITRWSFTNEYHYGGFRGDVERLLQSGYDVHLHYANYGTRRISLRLPTGIPFPQSLWSQYADGDDGFSWQKDREGKGGIIDLAPFHDAGTIDEIWDPEEYVQDCVVLRHHLIRGDLRALYLIWLCTAGGDYDDWQSVEPPVPLGLAEFAGIAGDLLDFFGVDPLILQAAAEGTPPLKADDGSKEANALANWVKQFKATEARRQLTRFLNEDPIAVKAELLAEFRDQSDVPAWPTVDRTRTFEQLMIRAQTLRDEETARKEAERKRRAEAAAAKAERDRQERMKQMVAAPQQWLKQAEQLVDARGTANYKAAADILADLREAIGGDEGEKMTRRHAARLAKKYPTLNHLKSSLRKRGLLG